MAQVEKEKVGRIIHRLLEMDSIIKKEERHLVQENRFKDAVVYTGQSVGIHISLRHLTPIMRISEDRIPRSVILKLIKELDEVHRQAIEQSKECSKIGDYNMAWGHRGEAHILSFVIQSLEKLLGLMNISVEKPQTPKWIRILPTVEDSNMWCKDQVGEIFEVAMEAENGVVMVEIGCRAFVVFPEHYEFIEKEAERELQQIEMDILHLSSKDYEQLIDMALDAKDEQWFHELINKRKQIHT